MTRKIFIIIALLFFVAAHAVAADKGNIELKSVAETEVSVKNDRGEKEVKLVDAAKARVVPGDTVVFTTYYANIGREAATSVVITNPVPEHMVYVDRSAEGKGLKAEFSVDGGRSYGLAKDLKVTQAGGRSRPAAAPDYTNIRWTLGKPLEAGGKGSVQFKAVLK